MKATCIVGSARADGSTAYLVDMVIKGMQESGIETYKYCMGNAHINFCCGCKKCYIDGKCVQQDDVENYWADVPGQLKTFFDRNTPYGDTNPNRIMNLYLFGKNLIEES